MCTPDSRVWISYNGEVYNYIELREELAGLGYRFETGTDTEVILASYREWGRDCVKRFNGMFAFVLVDLAAMSVLVARDRLGVKPIYLWSGRGYTLVVSEPKQLADFPHFRYRANRQQIVDFLIDGVAGHEPDQCFFEDVMPLPPGRTLLWKLGEPAAPPAPVPYWDPTAIAEITDWKEAVEKTRSLFTDSVKIRLRSDVPVGSCLSGGVDSSTIVGLLHLNSHAEVTTFSSCFHDKRFDESAYIDSVNRKWGSKGVKVFPDERGLIRDLETVAYHQDEPFASPSIYAQWCVMEAARGRGVPVLLDGQGGDELFGGYRKYNFFYGKQLLLGREYWKAALHAASVIMRGDRGVVRWRSGLRYLPEFLRRKTDPVELMLRPGWKEPARRVWAERMGNATTIRYYRWADLRNWSLPVLLRYEDRNSMAHAIETRLPFLDYRFVEHCLSLHESLLFRGGRTKRLLVTALSQALPERVRNRRTKMGFDTPSAIWMKGELGSILERRTCASERLSYIVDTRAAARAFQSYREGHKSHTDLLLFRIASLAVWLDQFEVEV